MKLVHIDGIPLRKLKDKYSVVIIKSLPEFSDLAANSVVYFDDEKMFFRSDPDCVVYFKKNCLDGGSANECRDENKSI